ncbi:MAG TPA: LuxR C-terminal-related transcriptional regulator [Chloroflexota bacterium]|jgi:PAS domain S-box-containing protein
MDGEPPGPEELYLAALEQLPTAIMVLDTAGQPVLVNDACRRILGQGLDATRPIDEQAGAFAPREATEGAPVPVASLVARVLAGDEIGAYELTMRPTNAASELWLRVSGAPLRDVNGRISGAAVVISDVTRERHLAQELRKAANENLYLHGTLAERERRLQDLVARWLEPQGGAALAHAGQRRNADDLTPREHDVLRLLGAGRTNQEIAGELQLALGTVRLHVKHILAKLGAANRTQAALSAWRLWGAADLGYEIPAAANQSKCAHDT